jgi:hypothetical protein
MVEFSIVIPLLDKYLEKYIYMLRLDILDFVFIKFKLSKNPKLP